MTDNNTKMNMLRRFAIGDILRRNAQRFPDKKALIFPSPTGEVIEYTWNEFNSSINRVANGLMALGIGKGDKVGIFSLNSPQFVIMTQALVKIGASSVTINASLRGEDVRFIVKQSDAKILFVEDIFVDAVKQILPDITDVKLGYLGTTGSKGRPEGWLDFNELFNNYPDYEPEVEIDIEDLATLTYTSGTEALPKGVMLTHGNWHSLALSALDWGLSKDDIILESLPLFYTGGMGVLYLSLLTGGTTLLLQLPDPGKIVEMGAKFKVTSIVLPPTVYVRLLGTPGIKEVASCLRKCITFGATMPEGMITGWNELAPHIQWLSLYASSELSCLGTVGIFKDIEDIPERNFAWNGKPASTLETRIVDDDNKDVPIGGVGEMVFRGPAVFKGYYKDEEKTDKVFADGWFHSGDLGRMNEEGEVFFVDRKKDMVKSGGENISCASVEFVVSSHPKVAEVAAFGVPHPDWMEALTVAVIPKEGGDILTEEEIIQHCREKLPKFKVPKYVIIANDFPRNPTGKILKRELRAMYKDLATKTKSIITY